MWLFRPPNGILVAQSGEFWICASRELSRVMLSKNLYCEIILIALQQSSLSDLHHQRKSRLKNFTGTTINLEYQAYLQKISLNSPDYHSELRIWSNQLSLEALGALILSPLEICAVENSMKNVVLPYPSFISLAIWDPRMGCCRCTYGKDDIPVQLVFYT